MKPLRTVHFARFSELLWTSTLWHTRSQDSQGGELDAFGEELDGPSQCPTEPNHQLKVGAALIAGQWEKVRPRKDAV